MTVELRAATDADTAEYLARARVTYLAELQQAGYSPEAAARNADTSFERAFPGGRVDTSHRLFRVEQDGERVGTLWIGPQPDGLADRWWVWDIVIDERVRGRGVGRATMLAAEAEARAAGAVELGLNVFGHNTTAIGLYRSLGYEVSAMQMRKAL